MIITSRSIYNFVLEISLYTSLSIDFIQSHRQSLLAKWIELYFVECAPNIGSKNTETKCSYFGANTRSSIEYFVFTHTRTDFSVSVSLYVFQSFHTFYYLAFFYWDIFHYIFELLPRYWHLPCCKCKVCLFCQKSQKLEVTK